MNEKNLLRAIILVLTLFGRASADEVGILGAEFRKTSGDSWSVSVTLKHGDTGWDHFADNWRVVDSEDNVLGDRVLSHPHEDEQPFTRGLGDVKVPEGVTTVYIEAHDKVHGWTKSRLKVDLGKVIDRRLLVEAVNE